MNNQPRILIVIPARKGSKRVPGKNIRPLGSKPLITWSIEASMGLPYVCDVLVSTDDNLTAEIARENGALVPWLRPNYLSTDSARTIDVVKHALNWYETERSIVDAVLLLQPTNPFRDRDRLIQGIDLFTKNRFDSIVGVRPTTSHPNWSYFVIENTLVPVTNEDSISRSQDLPKVVVISGSFYLSSTQRLRTANNMYDRNSYPLICKSEIEGIDIDTDFDFIIANFIAGQIENKQIIL